MEFDAVQGSNLVVVGPKSPKMNKILESREALELVVGYINVLKVDELSPCCQFG
jgi:hypothetical protein